MGLYLGIQCPSLMRVPPDEYPVRPAVYLVPEILLFGIRLSKLFPHAVPDVSLPSPAVDFVAFSLSATADPLSWVTAAGTVGPKAQRTGATGLDL